MSENNLRWPIWLGAILILALLGWEFRDFIVVQFESATETVQISPVEKEPEADTGPRYPVPEYKTPVDRELVRLPALDNSDAFFLLEVAQTFDPALEALLVREAVIDRIVATVDSLPRKQIPTAIRPVGQLAMSFHPEFGNSAITLGAGSYSRFNMHANLIGNANVDEMYDTYRRFYPLFQSAYRRLGYPDAYFNDRLVEVIDHLLATPMPDGPIVLKRSKVLYEFADPDLESLSSGQKLMLRMGPDNVATITPVLQAFRDRLTAGD